MTTYLMRHAPTTYSETFRVNGDSNVDVPLAEGSASACQVARAGLPLGDIVTCVVSRFQRCRQTAELIANSQVPIDVETLLDELDYGSFEGGEFFAYALWLAEHGPGQRPPGAGESQRQGIQRMLRGLAQAMSRPGPRLVVAHGLLLSVVQWALSNPEGDLEDVLLPAAPPLVPVALGDDELCRLIDRLMRGPEGERSSQNWRIDPGVFPVNLRHRLANVCARVPTGNAPNHQHEEAVTDA